MFPSLKIGGSITDRLVPKRYFYTITDQGRKRLDRKLTGSTDLYSPSASPEVVVLHNLALTGGLGHEELLGLVGEFFHSQKRQLSFVNRLLQYKWVERTQPAVRMDQGPSQWADFVGDSRKPVMGPQDVEAYHEDYEPSDWIKKSTN